MAPAACTGCPSELMPQLFTLMRALRQCHTATGKTQSRDAAMESSGNSDAVKGNSDQWESATQQKVVGPIQLEQCLSSWRSASPFLDSLTA